MDVCGSRRACRGAAAGAWRHTRRQRVVVDRIRGTSCGSIRRGEARSRRRGEREVRARGWKRQRDEVEVESTESTDDTDGAVDQKGGVSRCPAPAGTGPARSPTTVGPVGGAKRAVLSRERERDRERSSGERSAKTAEAASVEEVGQRGEVGNVTAERSANGGG